jgi:hypothetical protein
MMHGSTCSNGLHNDDARRLHLAKDVDDAATIVLGRLASVLERQLPKLHAHLVSCSCIELLFCYPCAGHLVDLINVVWFSFGAVLWPKATLLLSEGLACMYVEHRWVKMLLKRELPFEEVPRLWEACWCASTGLGVQPSTGGGSQGSGDGATSAPAVGEDFVLYCCAAILERKQKELIKSGNSLEIFFHCLRGVQSHAPELVQRAARLAQVDMKRNRTGGD